MIARSNRREVRNPILALPSAGRVAGLPQPARVALQAILIDLATDARARAQASWRSHKAPMALYWKMVAVYARHIARAIPSN